jgi:hypothetical protein
MFKQGKTGSLNQNEKRIVKYLCNRGATNQDIQAEINLCRPATVNSGRISAVKNDPNQAAASEVEFRSFEVFKRSFDFRTGLNPFTDEILIKSREAMKLAVSVFNNPTLNFRAENFSILANIAWTYFALKYSDLHNMPTTRANGLAISLADFVRANECPFDDGTKNNLKALIKIRDATEHTAIGFGDDTWAGIFQATCVNYERELTKHFGARLSLAAEIAFSLQLSSLSLEQVASMATATSDEKVAAINAELYGGMTEAQKNDQSFQFSVVYTTVASSKSKSTLQFVSPLSAEGRDIVTVLVKHKPSADSHPYRPSQVVQKVVGAGYPNFNSHSHTSMWRSESVRPAANSDKPSETNLDYCYYNPTFRSYTYNDAWVQKVLSNLNNQP